MSAGILPTQPDRPIAPSKAPFRQVEDLLRRAIGQGPASQGCEHALVDQLFGRQSEAELGEAAIGQRIALIDAGFAQTPFAQRTEIDACKGGKTRRSLALEPRPLPVGRRQQILTEEPDRPARPCAEPSFQRANELSREPWIE